MNALSKEKTLARRKLLQPLPPPLLPWSGEVGRRPSGAHGTSSSHGTSRARAHSAATLLSENIQAPATPCAALRTICTATPPATPHRAWCSRPGTADGLIRPETAERSGRPALGSEIAFPAQLHLRSAGEPANSPGFWTRQSGALMLSLQAQHEIRRIAGACSENSVQVSDGAYLTAWAVDSQERDNGPQLLEPLAAHSLHKSLEIEPVEMVLERQHASTEEDAATPLCYGEGFRLRTKGTDLYLTHAGIGGALGWARNAQESVIGQKIAPHSLRFTAHGGELGAPVLFCRPISMQRVRSPAPDEDSSSESEDDSEHFRRMRKQERKGMPGAMIDRCPQDQEGLFSRLADKGNVFHATFIPLPE